MKAKDAPKEKGDLDVGLEDAALAVVHDWMMQESPIPPFYDNSYFLPRMGHDFVFYEDRPTKTAPKYAHGTIKGLAFPPDTYYSESKPEGMPFFELRYAHARDSKGDIEGVEILYMWAAPKFRNTGIEQEILHHALSEIGDITAKRGAVDEKYLEKLNFKLSEPSGLWRWQGLPKGMRRRYRIE